MSLSVLPSTVACLLVLEEATESAGLAVNMANLGTSICFPKTRATLIGLLESELLRKDSQNTFSSSRLSWFLAERKGTRITWDFGGGGAVAALPAA